VFAGLSSVAPNSDLIDAAALGTDSFRAADAQDTVSVATATTAGIHRDRRRLSRAT
jgi:hypothetical protein